MDIHYLLAFCLTVLILWLGQPLAHRYGLVDLPNLRKHHKQATPLIGGVAMLCGFLPGILILDGLAMPHLFRFLVVVTLLMVVGVWDDFCGLPVRFRVLSEVALAFVMTFASGVTIDSLGNLMGTGTLYLGIWSVPFTIVCVVGVINALNMTDGLDGLAGGLSFVSFLAIFMLAIHAGRWHEARVILVLFTVLVPFLLFNVSFNKQRPAKVFMGDAGSMFLGFVLVWFSVSLSQGDNPAFSPITAVWLIAVPLLEMFGSFFRRLLQKRSPFHPDRDHLHHLLLKKGFSEQQTVLILIGFSLILCGVGIGGFILEVDHWVMFLGLLLLFALTIAWTKKSAGGTKDA